MISALSSNFSFAQRGLRDAQSIIQSAAERLSTGRRINRASDDPSGLAAADQLTSRIESIKHQINNFDQEEAHLGAKEGALSVVSGLLSELNGVVVTAANRGALAPPELDGLQSQADSIIEALDFISNTATFKGEKLFEGLLSTSLGRTSATVRGQEDDAKMVDAVLASMHSGGVMNLLNGDLEAAQRSVEGAIDSVSGTRAAIGSRITDQIQHERDALLSELENSESARSQIVDADVAQEMANLVRGQILQQASISALLIARQSPKVALQLLSTNLAISRQS
ncbi:MAG: flagellin [Phycisphaerales bacterium]|nr:flagellin [Phycisphaerales bacterium]